MNDFTFLTKEQCFSEKLEILEKRGTIARITDFSILLCGHVSDNDYYNNGNSLEDRAGSYWTSSEVKGNEARAVTVDYTGHSWDADVVTRSAGARPVLPYSSIRNVTSNEVKGSDGILEVEYGEYPQKVASKKLQDELEKAYNDNQSSIKKTGKTYATDSRRFNEYYEGIDTQIIEEYLFDDGKKYVRVKSNSSFNVTLSNGEKYKYGDYVWVEVQPIKWLIDEKSDIALSEKVLFAGVPFKHENNYKGDFGTTDIKEFMDKHFAKDITPSFTTNISLEQALRELKVLKKTLEETQNELNILKQTTGTGSLTGESNNNHK